MKILKNPNLHLLPNDFPLSMTTLYISSSSQSFSCNSSQPNPFSSTHLLNFFPPNLHNQTLSFCLSPHSTKPNLDYSSNNNTCELWLWFCLQGVLSSHSQKVFELNDATLPSSASFRLHYLESYTFTLFHVWQVSTMWS